MNLSDTDRERADQVVVKFSGVGKSFREITALEGVDLEVRRSATHLLLGPNGSGKTTLLRLLAGVLRPTGGTLSIDGVDPYRAAHRLARRLGIAYENHFLPQWASGRALLEFAAKSKGLGAETVMPVADVFGLRGFWERPIETYSSGMRKRLMLAQGCLGDPALLVLDEPFSNLDPEGRALLGKYLGVRASRGGTTLVATHLLDTTVSPTHVTFLADGRVAASGPVPEFGERFQARTVEFLCAEPTRAVGVLLAGGIGAVGAATDRVTIRGDSERIQQAVILLQEGGIKATVEREYVDLWSIYRAVMSPEGTPSQELDK